jgi:hypothetical protein
MVEPFLLWRNKRASHMKNRFFLRFAQLATGLLTTCHLSAQPKAIAFLQPVRIETGDTTGLLILVSGLSAEPKDVDFSSWASVFSTTNIIGRSEWRRSGAQWTRRFTLIAFDSATLELPYLNVQLATGKPLQTNGLTLTVFPSGGGREIKDMARIRDIHREPESWLDYWPWAGVFLLGLVLLGWWLRKNQGKIPPIVLQNQASPRPLSATELALQKLAQLQQKQLWKQDQSKEHYAELSLILRTYLETRYGFAALESTSTEIKKMLQTTDLSPEACVELNELLQKSDLVKYAQSQYEEAMHEALLVKARELLLPGKAKPPDSIIKSTLEKPHRTAIKSGNHKPL